MTRDKAIVKLVQEVDELLADYANMALDEDGKLDAFRKRRIAKIGRLLTYLKTGQGW